MSRRGRKHGWFAALAGLAAGGGLCCAPPVVQQRLRLMAADALRPGLAGMANVRESSRRLLQSRDDAKWERREQSLLAEVERWRTAAHRSTALADSLRKRMANVQAENPIPFSGLRGNPLFVPEMIEAQVLKRSGDAETGTLSLLDSGGLQGVVPAQWALTASDIADQGEGALIQPDDPVLAGRTVYGRIAATGRWTSQVQHISDPGFRAHVKLVRATSDGTVNGAEGILAGAGEGRCRLELIPATQPVEVGDLIFTAGTVPGIDESLYVASVTRAELPTGSVHWEIEARPGVAAAEVDRVQIVRIGLNPARRDDQTPSDGSSHGEVKTAAAEESRR
jgi:hypothetical protein